MWIADKWKDYDVIDCSNRNSKKNAKRKNGHKINFKINRFIRNKNQKIKITFEFYPQKNIKYQLDT